MTTIQDLNDIMIICRDELESINLNTLNKDITIGFMQRKTTVTLGTCTAIARGYSNSNNYRFEIVVNREFADVESYELIKDVIMHELIHTFYPRDGHTGRFKQVASLVNYKLGYDVARRIETENFKRVTRQKNVKYISTCEKCNHSDNYYRTSKFIKNPERYRCSLCGGDFKITTL